MRHESDSVYLPFSLLPCIAVDTWDGKNGTPVVYHGHTLTSKLAFRDVVQTIMDHAFDATDYPLILSIENHCGYESGKRRQSSASAIGVISIILLVLSKWAS